MRDKRWVCFLIAVLVIALDRWSKLWVVAHIKTGAAITVIPKVFRITHVLNFGAAFSLFGSSGSPDTVRRCLIGFSLVASVAVIVLLWKWGRTITLTSFALSLILGGAIGNLYDRAKFKFVVDFLEVHIGSYHWPDFNVADSAIVVGACLLLLETLWPRKQNS